MNSIRQMWAVAALNVRNLRRRMGTALVVVIGTGAAVTILVSAIAMLATIENAMHVTAKLNRAIVLSQRAFGEWNSSLSRSMVGAITDAPGIRHGIDGKPAASAELSVGVRLPRRDGRIGFSAIRGIAAAAFAVHPEIDLTAGRLPQPAVHEVIVSKRAREQFANLNIGDHVPLAGGPWEIVGEFESDGFHDNEMVADPDTVMSAYHQSAFQSVLVTLDGSGALATLQAALKDNPQAQVSISMETEYQGKIAGFLMIQIWFVVIGVGGILGLGAIFAALNAMYASTSTRTIEIATLRAIGFDGGSVATSVFAEALLLAILGGLIGAALAWAVVDHAVIEAGPTFEVRVTLLIVILGLGVAVIIGAVGALFPAIRAARLPIATALQRV